MIPFSKVGGWARLALVLGVVWTLFIGVLTVNGMPARDDYVVASRGPDGIVYDPVTQLQERRRAHIQGALLRWGIPIVVLYSIGFTTRWVFRGFSRSS